jgi:hypothetical protein
MLKTLALTAAIGLASVLLAADAGAAPLAQGLQTLDNAEIVLVRDGCGRGMRYSRRAGGCVVDNVPPPRVVAPVVPACPWGFRWSNRWSRCVPI